MNLPNRDGETAGHIVMRIEEKFVSGLLPILQKTPLTFPQYILLCFLRDESKPLSMTAIAGFMNHSTAATTGLIDRLEQKRIVVRCPSKEDRRKVFVAISKKGLSLLENIQAEQKRETVLEPLSSKERSMWMTLHEKIFGLNIPAALPSQELVAV